jgi:hypothetical protein
MAMSRSFGCRPLTMRLPMAMVPPLMSSNPGHHAQRCGLAAARRPTKHDEFVVGDVAG